MTANGDFTRLAQAAAAWSLPVDPGALERVAGFTRRLLEWNAAINLTGARTFEEIVDDHLGDAFAMASLVAPDADVLDVGSGGGLPALPFAILRPDARVTLVEPRAKRASFLRTAVREFAPAARVLLARIENVTEGPFDVVGARATFPPDEWLDRARALVRDEGRALVFAAQSHRPGGGWALAEERSYRTAAGRPRWVGAFVPRGTT